MELTAIGSINPWRAQAVDHAAASGESPFEAGKNIRATPFVNWRVGRIGKAGDATRGVASTRDWSPVSGVSSFARMVGEAVSALDLAYFRLLFQGPESVPPRTAMVEPGSARSGINPNSKVSATDQQRLRCWHRSL